MTNVGSNYTPDYASVTSGADTWAVDRTNRKYDAHYLLGNYYTWNAATAGSGVSLTSGEAADSICPKGWHLPTANNSERGSFNYLATSYGFSMPTGIIGSVFGVAPFYFVQGGFVRRNGSAGYYGINWVGTYLSSTAQADTRLVYGMDTTYRNVYVGNAYRHIGYSVRCVANFEDTLDDITYMQEMTAEVCTNTRTPSASETITAPAKQLIDSRDGKKYWVAKLADGNCWMTQNLDLDLDSSVALTPEDSDVSENWTPGESTRTSYYNTGNTNYLTVQSFDVGDYVMIYPNSGNNLCTTGVAYITSCSGYSSLANVSSSGGYTPDYVATGSGTSVLAVDFGNKKYDAHYLLGNYYSWDAATVESGGDASEYSDAASSICPKGWTLPISQSTDNGSLSYLMSAQGIINSAATTLSRLGSSPSYFHRAGLIRPTTSSGMLNVGTGGYYWSKTAAPYNGYTYASALYFENTDIYPLTTTQRHNNYPIRCIAK